MIDFAKWFMGSGREARHQTPSTEGEFNLFKRADTSAGFTVLKEKSGNYRWVAVSSNAFIDGDKEIVSTKALEEDAARTGNRGPLRWWHEPQLDLGVADFSGMHGKMLIESGTFNSPEIAMAIAEKAKGLSMSVGFVHPHTEPDADGIFHNIKIFERSLLPVEKASNKFTKFEIVEDNTMNETKYKALQELVGDALVAKILANAAVSEKEAMDEGLRFKEKKVARADKESLSSLTTEELDKLFEEALAETKKELDESDAADADDVEYAEDWQSKIIEEKTMKAKSQPVDEVEGEEEEMEVMSSKKGSALSTMMGSKGMAKSMASKKAASAAVDPEDEEEADAAEEMEEEGEGEAATSDKAHAKAHARMEKKSTKAKKYLAPDEDEEEDEEEDDDEDAISEKEYDDDDDEVTEKELGDGDEIAYLSPNELADLLTNTISEVVTELGVTEKMKTVTKELRVVKDVLREFDARIKGSLEAVTTKEKNTQTLMAQIENLSERLKELEGEAPKASKKGYRASQDGDTEIDDSHRLKGAEPTADPLDHFRSFLNGHKN